MSSFIDDIRGSDCAIANNNPVIEFPSLSSQSSHLPTATDDETISTKASTNNDGDHQVSSCNGSSCSKPSAHGGNGNTKDSCRFAARTASTAPTTLDTILPTTRKSSPAENTTDEDEMEIEINFDNNCNSADHIKNALEKLVATAKNKKKQAIELEKQPIATNTKVGSGGETLEGATTKSPSKQKKPIQVIINWMDSFQDDEKIQLLCLQALPTILVDPVSRLLAQTDGLTSIVFFNMIAFPDNPILQLHAFHTLVVLLRSAAAYEGKTASVKRRHNKHDASSIIQHGKLLVGSKRKAALPDFEDNGVRVMLASLRRYSNDMYIQAIGCWALVNAALYPSLKTSLTRLGAVYTVTNAMMLHPNVEAVQYRGLFALINLVIPDDKKRDGDGSSISSHVYQISRLTIVAMKNFHSNKSILNQVAWY